MVNGPLVQSRIYYGYKRCADKLGFPFTIYRSPSPINPISSPYDVGTILVSLTQSWDYMKAGRYNMPIWIVLADGRDNINPHIEDWDFIVQQSGETDEVDTYFIASKQSLLPINAVLCNRTIDIVRPSQTTGAGLVPYAGRTPQTDITIMQGIPASVLIDGKAKNEVHLPTDAQMPRWQVLIPDLGGVIIRIDDIIIDSFEQEYVVTNNELTDLGWRLSAQQVINSG